MVSERCVSLLHSCPAQWNRCLLTRLHWQQGRGPPERRAWREAVHFEGLLCRLRPRSPRKQYRGALLCAVVAQSAEGGAVDCCRFARRCCRRGCDDLHESVTVYGVRVGPEPNRREICRSEKSRQLVMNKQSNILLTAMSGRYVQLLIGLVVQYNHM